MRRLACLAVAVLVACAAFAAASAPSALAESSPAGPPPGANDFHCRPSSAHPDPVVLVHGLGATMAENWGYMSPLLAKHGYCVFALTYGLNPLFPFAGGVEPIQTSAPELAAFVTKVLAATGAKKVDLVGHSEGTFMPQYYLKFLGGKAKVKRYVAMAPLYRGTNLLGLATLRDVAAKFGLAKPLIGLVSVFCGSCSQFLAGSPMVHKLTAGGAAVPGVQYTTIPTRYDELVSPYTSGILPAAPNVTNEVLQDVCPNDVSEHVAEAFDPVVAQIIFNALDPQHAHRVSCAGLPPLAPPPSG